MRESFLILTLTGYLGMVAFGAASIGVNIALEQFTDSHLVIKIQKSDGEYLSEE